MRRIDVAERRARLGRRHHLAPAHRAQDVDEVVENLVALHSTDPATVHLAAWARLVDPDVAAVEHALYEERRLVRVLAMRRTIWVVPVGSLPRVEAAASRTIATRQRRDLVKVLQEQGLGGEPWLAKVEAATLEALARRDGAALGAELSADVPDLRTKYTYAEGAAYGGEQSMTTRILNVMAMSGHIVRGRPRGAWNSSQYRWSPRAAWLPAGVAEPDKETAQAELLEAWLRSFGPGTLDDLKWWSGLTLGEVRQALARLEVAEVDLGGSTGVVLADDVDPVEAPEPWVALLPSLDPTAMGWVGREWYLGEHKAALFDRTGNIGPTVWSDGRIVGGWAQRKDTGEVVFRLLEDVGAEATAAVEAEAARLTTWIGDVRVTPRFRTPLDRELTA